MRKVFKGPMTVAFGTVLGLCVAMLPAAGQTSAYQGPRTKDGKPNLTGVWQSMTTANYDLLAHAAHAGHVLELGAEGAVPGGIGVVEGNEIPYLPAALAKRKENYEKRFTDDPEIKCYMPGVPRANYMPFPFQIIQSQDMILMAYEFANASRQIYMKNAPKDAPDSWMGHSVGHWDGDTLVVDNTSFNDQSWFDRTGNYHSDQLHVVERYVPISADAIRYEATIEDPKVFSRPWKINVMLYRHLEKNAQLMEFRCTEFVEELMYGKYRKKN